MGQPLSVGTAYARQKGQYRRQFGTPIIFDDAKITVRPGPVRVISRPLSQREMELLPEGVGLNAAASDRRIFEGSPADFAARPLPEQTLLWQGDSYTVVFCAPADEIAGVPHTYNIFSFRTPAPDAATTETAQKAALAGTPQAAGRRKVYLPPDNTGS